MHLLRAAAQALLCIPRTSRVRCRAPIRVQVAQGMAGLEGAQPPIVHRDLKPSNVFVDGAGGARVADMNLSLRLHEDCLANLTGETGTYLYMSPEMMRHEVRPAPSAAACLFRSFPVFSGLFWLCQFAPRKNNHRTSKFSLTSCCPYVCCPLTLFLL